jgi:hypothetical protein
VVEGVAEQLPPGPISLGRIMGRDQRQNVIAGDTATVTVVFPTKAALVFYCKIHGAEGHGGELFVP